MAGCRRDRSARDAQQGLSHHPWSEARRCRRQACLAPSERRIGALEGAFKAPDTAKFETTEACFREGMLVVTRSKTPVRTYAERKIVINAG